MSLDRVEHALDHDHDANPVAGSVQTCADGATCKGSSDHQDVSHVHIGDTATVFTLSADPVVLSHHKLVSGHLISGDQSEPLPQYTSLDRPPKA